MENLRIRLMFEDRNILSKTQRSQGLNQSWLLLKPDQHPKFSDVSAHLLHIFDLHHSCPNGLLLYMDGFVLPPFESTCILKDKDIISVKKKGGRSTNIVKVGDTTEEPEIVEKQPLHTGVPLLANEEFEKEAGGYRSESEENEERSEDTGVNAISKKRKASRKLHSSKKKKHRLMVPDGVDKGHHKDQIESNNDDGVLSRKSPCKKETTSNPKSKRNRESTPESAEKIANSVNQGKLVPEEVIFGLLSKRLEEGNCKGESGFILDGIPRTKIQAEILDEFADIDLVLNFKCTEDCLVKSHVGGQGCSSCQDFLGMGSSTLTRNLHSKVDKTEPDSTVPEGVHGGKLRTYAEQNKPIEDYYKKQKKLLDFQVAGAPGETWHGLLAALHLQHMSALNSSQKLNA